MARLPVTRAPSGCAGLPDYLNNPLLNKDHCCSHDDAGLRSKLLRTYWLIFPSIKAII